MRDYLGSTLEVGNDVVCMVKNYRELVRATVVGITPQRVKVEYREAGRTAPVTYTTPGNTVVLIESASDEL